MLTPLARPVSFGSSALPVFPFGASQDIATSGVAAWGTALHWRTSILRLAATQNARVLIGAAPTAVAASPLVIASETSFVRINADQKVLSCMAEAAGNTFRFFENAGNILAPPVNNNFRGNQVALATGQAIYFSALNGSVLPAPLAENTPYYMRADGTISASITGVTPGSAVDITDAGTGNFVAITADRISAIQEAAAGKVNVVELR